MPPDALTVTIVEPPEQVIVPGVAEAVKGVGWGRLPVTEDVHPFASEMV